MGSRSTNRSANTFLSISGNRSRNYLSKLSTVLRLERLTGFLPESEKIAKLCFYNAVCRFSNSNGDPAINEVYVAIFLGGGGGGRGGSRIVDIISDTGDPVMF